MSRIDTYAHVRRFTQSLSLLSALLYVALVQEAVVKINSHIKTEEEGLAAVVVLVAR